MTGRKAMMLVFAVLILIVPSAVFGTAEQEDTSTSETYTLEWLGSGYPLRENSWGEQFMEDRFGIEIEPANIDIAEEYEKANLRFAAGWVPDVIMVPGTQKLTELVRNGILGEIPVEMIRKHAPHYYDLVLRNDPYGFRTGTVNGTNYSLPRGLAYNRPWSVAIRADWLERLGEDIPETIEDLEDVFIKFRNNDPDGNGLKDTFGMTAGINARNGWFNSIFGAFGMHPFQWIESGGEIVHGFTLAKDALKLLNRWYELELIDPEWLTTKHRTNSADDVAYMFASGRVGYLDNLAFDDHQWDNGGHLNAKWVANHPGWQDFFEDQKNWNVTKPFLDFPEKEGRSVPGPVYINMKPPKGPGGSGTFGWRIINAHIAVGNHVPDDEGKLIKILEIFDTLVSDEEAYISAQFGPEGKHWEFDAEGHRVTKPEWEDDPDFHPQGRYMGTGMFFNPYAFNPDFLYAYGGAFAVQRYQWTMPPLTEGVRLMASAVPVSLPSQGEYYGDLLAYLVEYIPQAITGRVDIDATFDDTVAAFMANGGKQLTEEANDWYESAQQ